MVATEDGRNVILSRGMSEEELETYGAHPDAYFGVLQSVTKKVDNVYELFESMVDCYKNTPRERLLEFCREHSDTEKLKELDHLDLVLEVCERWASAAAASDRSLASGGEMHS